MNIVLHIKYQILENYKKIYNRLEESIEWKIKYDNTSILISPKKILNNKIFKYEIIEKLSKFTIYIRTLNGDNIALLVS